MWKFIFIGCLIAGIFLIRSRSQEMQKSSSRFATVADATEVKSLAAKTNSDDAKPNQQKSEIKSSASNDQNSVSHTETTSKRKTVMEYTETFPGLASVDYLLNGTSDGATLSEKVSARSRIGSKHGFDPFHGKRLRLVELNENSLLTFDDGKNLSKILKSVRSNLSQSQKHFFQNQEQLKILTRAQSDDLPICILNTKPAEDDSQDSDSLLFTVTKIVTPLKEYPGYLGTRILLKSELNRDQWIQSIDCILKSKNETDERYEEIQFVHLLATFGWNGSAQQ